MSAERAGPSGGAFGRLRILPAERRIEIDGRPAALGSRAFDLLAALVARRDRVVPKDELMDAVWPGLVVEENNLQVQISALRKLLGAQAIATVPGRGYRFTVAGEAQDAAAPSAERAASARMPLAPWPAHGRGGVPMRAARLLVADDNKVNRLLLCRSLSLMGHEVTGADNGRVALEMLRGERFDLLLLDLEMPELDGFGLLERRAAEPALLEVPVIVTSSLEGVAAIARCIELGADDYLHKPVNPVLLKARVDSSLERKRLRDRQRELLARLAPGLPGVAPMQGASIGAAAEGSAGVRRVEAALLVARLLEPDTSAAMQTPHETLEQMDHWSALMLDALEGHAGCVNELTGDGLAAVFGAPLPMPSGGDASRAAAAAAREMRELLALFNAERSAAGRPPVCMRIGIATGEVVAGCAGLPRRAAYVCIGAAARRARQLAELAAPQGAAACIDEASRAALADRAATDALPPAVLAGGTAAAAVYALRQR